MPTRIEWCEETWNPVTGCTPVSEGCQNCYAYRMAKRLRGRYGYPQDEPFRVTFHPDRLEQPLHWKKPRRIFVCSMGDLFHEKVQDEWILTVFLTMIRPKCDHHTYLLLTKRPHRMREFIQSLEDWQSTQFPHIWFGVTVESDKYRWRIKELLKIPGIIYFVSHEPGLGKITYPKEFLALCDRALIITGGETGPGARPMHPDIPRSDRDQCQAAGIPFFFKSWGEYSPEQPANANRGFMLRARSWAYVKPDGKWCDYDSFSPEFSGDDAWWVGRVGKKRAGRVLDGREWNDYPSTKGYQP